MDFLVTSPPCRQPSPHSHLSRSGFFELFLCDTDELDASGVETQACFNAHQLLRSPNDDAPQPIDPNYPGRYYLEPACLYRQFEGPVAGDDYSALLNTYGGRVRARYILPANVTCER